MNAELLEYHLYCDASVGSQGRLNPGDTALATSTFYYLWPDGDFLGGTSSFRVPHGRSDIAELEGLRRGLRALCELTLQDLILQTRKDVGALVLVHCDNRSACEKMREEFRPEDYPGIAQVECRKTNRNHPIIKLCHDECGDTRWQIERMRLGKPPL